jgi:hypothetical protein
MMAVSTTNLKKGRRNKEGGWMLAALLPVLSKKKLPSYMKKHYSRLKMQLWHQCISIVTKTLAEKYGTGEAIKCGDGLVRSIKPVLAAWLGDRKEGEFVCAAYAVRVLIINAQLY